MHQHWTYEDAAGVRREGVFRGYTDFGGTDVTYRFRRLDGSRTVDLVSGPRLKAAERLGAVPDIRKLCPCRLPGLGSIFGVRP